jgi:ABC-type nitrate/sulfonate/bicarbonate transport system permease component
VIIRLLRPASGICLRLCPLAVALAAWELVTRRVVDPFFPPPSTFMGSLHHLWFSGPASGLWLTADARANLLPSITRLLAGWIAASVFGIAFGIALGRCPRLSDYLSPMTRLARAIPPPTLAPVFLALFKIGTETQLFTIFFGAIWPIVNNTADGARTIDPVHLDLARVYRLSRWQQLRLIVLPSAAPKIAAGLRVSLPIAVILMVLSELTASTNGIGYRLLLLSQTTFDLPGLWAGIAVLGLLGLALNMGLLVLERRVLAWHLQSSSRRVTVAAQQPTHR